MSLRYLGFVLLFLLSGALQVQSAAQFCSAPSLDGGYFVPEEEQYPQRFEITYACYEGRKPTVKGWWAKSSCEGDSWSPVPQCIDETSCLRPPKIPNAQDIKGSEWYKHGKSIRITCDDGYEVLNQDVTAECSNGSWSSLPICEISPNACSEPPQIPHAVVVGLKYKEVFAEDSVVQYECEDGYTVEGAESTKTITCSSGAWTEGPTCSEVRPYIIEKTTQDTGRGGSAGVGTSGGQTTSTGSRTQTVAGGGGTTPNTGRDVSTVEGRVSGGRQGGSTVEGTAGGHSTSSSFATTPSGGGSSTGDNRPLILPVNECGKYPVVENGVLVETERMYLKYQCSNFYKRVGPEEVVCYSSSRWSDPPRCEEDFCVADAAEYSNLERGTGNFFVQKGEKGTQVPCLWPSYTSLFKCINGLITHTRCCHEYDHRLRRC